MIDGTPSGFRNVLFAVGMESRRIAAERKTEGGFAALGRMGEGVESRRGPRRLRPLLVFCL